MISDVFNQAIKQLKCVEEAEAGPIRRAAELVADAIAADKIFYLFGSGHSAFIAGDAYWRAGGLAPALPIPEPLGGDAERLPGFAAVLLGHYQLQAGSVIIIISNSGINPLPIELAMECHQLGLKVVAITNKEHSAAVPVRHAGGKKLMELADVVIDTHGVPGDAALTLPGTNIRVGPTSTAVGTTIIQAIVAEAAGILQERGIQPPVIISANLPEGDAWNRKLAEKYRSQLVRCEISTVDRKLDLTHPGGTR